MLNQPEKKLAKPKKKKTGKKLAESSKQADGIILQKSSKLATKALEYKTYH